MTCLYRWQHLPRICLALLSLFACLFAAETHGLVLAQEGKTDYQPFSLLASDPARTVGRVFCGVLGGGKSVFSSRAVSLWNRASIFWLTDGRWISSHLLYCWDNPY